MRVEFTINNSSAPEARYLTWTKSPLRLRLLDAAPSASPVRVTLSMQRQPNGGALRFSPTASGTLRTTLVVPLSTNESGW